MWLPRILFLAAVIVVLLGAVLIYLVVRKPVQTSPRAGRVDMSPARVERGRYIFENLADCTGCHSQRDFSRFGGPVVPGGRGRGFTFPPEFGLPGTIVASNITPDRETGIGTWSDGEKIRAIRDGVDKDGRALFPLMPYPAYRKMSDEDVESVVAYMNTLAPVRTQLPPTRIAFPVSLFIKGVPQPAGGVPPANRPDRVKYGEYLATIGGCAACHTPFVRGRPDASKHLAGGRVFRLGNATVVSSNITPDGESGIGNWSEQHFLDKFAEYKEYALKGPPPAGAENFTVMPWLGLSQASDDDLRAMYAYLRTQPAVRNAVEKHPAPGKQPGS
jgi:mono/diheme cytochrome c family protein